MSAKKLSFKEAIDGIKKLLKFDDAAAAGDMATADALKDYTTDSGAKVKIDKLETGGKVFAEDGTTPITAGVTLSDGTILAIGPDGVITAVTVPAPAADPSAITDTPAMLAMREMAAKFAAGTPEERIANLETMNMALMQYAFGWKIDEATRKSIEDSAIAAYKVLGTPAAADTTQMAAQFAEQKQALGAEKTARIAAEKKYDAALQTVVTVLEQFAAAPSDDPIQDPADKGTAPSRKEQAAAFLETLKNK